MATIDTIAKTLVSIATPGMKRKDLFAAVREKHPNASKKEIVRAAFYALTDSARVNGDKAHQLHDFALIERASETEEPIAK